MIRPSGFFPVFVMLLLGACAPSAVRDGSEPVQVRGQSEATLKAAYSASKLIWHTVQNQGRCRDGVAFIDRRVLERSPDFNKDAAGQIALGSVTERWDANGCGKIFLFSVKFAADGKGGTDIYTSPIKEEWK